MKIEQIYTGCLAEAAYYIQSNGEAAIIDPLRETEPYLDRAENDNSKIKYIFLTHFHADFVSGHVDLAKKTGAQIVFGPGATGAFDFHESIDGEIFEVGNVTLEVVHTPGHTMESSSYLLKDKQMKPQCIFTGDTLFIGDVGRPDLAIKQGTLTEKDLAKHLFHSLRNKIMTLPDDIIVYPNHGAGSACGKNMSSETYDTLGHQKAVNYALRDDMSEDEFVKEVLSGLSTPPQYFPKNVMMNKGINEEIDNVISKGSQELSVENFKKLCSEDALILDVRSPLEFTTAHIPGSIFIGLDGQFAPWVGALILDINQKIILIAPEGREEEAVTRLARIGYDNTFGYLAGGLDEWVKCGEQIASIKNISPQEFESNYLKNDINVLDVRKKSEWEAEHIEGVVNEPLDTINSKLSNLHQDKTYYIHCAGGYRSVIFSSIAKRKGYDHIINIDEGFEGISAKTALKKTEYVCPTSLS